MWSSRRPGPVFVRCGAAVGRARTTAATDLVRTAEQSPSAAVRRDPAVGPPSWQ
ncbi:hypothetical protein ACW4TU_34695 [Streptomyces sp. QTS52]